MRAPEGGQDRPDRSTGAALHADISSRAPLTELLTREPGPRRGIEELTARTFGIGDAAQRNPDVARLVAAEQEVGCHSLYHETLGDELFPIPAVRPVLPEEVELRIRRATEWVAEASGTRPVSFRCPRLWGSTQVVNVLESLGYVCDATYPMYFHRQRFEPYHPDAADWLHPGGLRILEVPNFADMRMTSKDPPLERDRDHWPLFRIGDGSGIYRCVDSFLRFAEERRVRPVLCFYFHPWEFHPMKDRYDFGEATVLPYPMLVENCGEAALDLLGRLIDYLASGGCRFVRADQLAREWDAAG